jgi:hypothetical protein
MKFTNHITTFFLYFFLFPAILSSFNYVDAQETNGHASGRVLSEKNEIISHANVTVLHEPTQSKYVAVSRDDGYFYFFNIKSGGPYSITISSIGYESLNRTNLHIHLASEHFSINNSESSQFILQEKMVTLQEVVIDADNVNRYKSGIETNITHSGKMLQQSFMA